MVGLSDPVRGGVAGRPINQTEGFGMYVQAGYYLPQWKIQPWANYEYWDATDAFGSWAAYRIGLNYYVRGFDANVRLGYERVQTQHDIGLSRTANSGHDTINTVMLALYFDY